ncbi:MAG: hypothetical protein QOI63_261 [Thermoplasmata archaeon]|jgi:hypothetical protein|nr:hypothetical protein [Thermoplasmata archaeon]
MAIAMLIEFPGTNLTQYDRVVGRLNLKGRTYQGGLFHVAGATDDGVRIVDVWESQAAFDAFLNDKLTPALEAEGMEAPEVKTWEVHNTLTPTGPLPLKATPTLR